MLRVIKGTYFLTILVLSLIVSFLGVFITTPIYRGILRRMDGANVHFFGDFWSKILFTLTPGWHLKITGRELLPKPGTPVVFVSNHESNADVWAMFQLGCNFKWLGKAEVFRIPVIGWAMRYGGYVPVERGNKESGAAAMVHSRQWLDRGIPMFFFPEGTRSKTGELLPFKIGAFKLARDAHVAIQPLIIKGTKDLLAKGSVVPGRSTVTVKVLPAMSINTSEPLDELAARIRQLIIDEQRKL